MTGSDKRLVQLELVQLELVQLGLVQLEPVALMLLAQMCLLEVQLMVVAMVAEPYLDQLLHRVQVWIFLFNFDLKTLLRLA